MKMLACNCGTEIRVDDSCHTVTCYKCFMTSSSVVEPNVIEVKTEKKEESVKKEELIKVDPPKPKEKVRANVMVSSCEGKEAKGTVNGEEFVAIQKIGADKKEHWIVDNRFTRGQKIRISREINKFISSKSE